MRERLPLPREKPEKNLWPWLVFLNFLLLAGVCWLALQKTHQSRESVQGLSAIVAKVNGQPLFARDLLSTAPFTGDQPDAKKWRGALERMIEEEVVAQQAKNPPAPPAKIDGLWETLRHQFPDPARLNAALEAAGLSENDLRQRLSRHSRIEIWLHQAAASHPTEAECRAWFEANPEIRMLPEVVQATHFAAIYPQPVTPEECLGKGDLIRDAQKRWDDGIPFSQLIDALSDDPAKKVTHGSLFWFRRERMEPPLADAAFRQPLNEVGPPVETRFGFHLLLVTAHQPAASLAYEQVAGEVRQRCQAGQERKKIKVIVANLRQRAKIEILDPRLRTPSL